MKADRLLHTYRTLNTQMYKAMCQIKGLCAQLFKTFGYSKTEAKINGNLIYSVSTRSIFPCFTLKESKK